MNSGKVSKDKWDETYMITKIQALVRAYLQRRKYKVQQVVVDLKTKYFKLEEAKETLSSDKYDEN